jgi:hypothetical protein
MAASLTCTVAGTTGLVYTTTATSNGISVNAGAPTAVYYVDNALSSASNKTNPTPPPPNPYTLVVSGDWCINTTTGAFTGNIAYGDYKTQTNVTGFPTIDGRQTFVGVNQAFSGTGTWGTNGSGDPTLSFSYFNTTVNGGGASVQTQTSSSCANGQTNFLGKVCTSFATASKDWEGLSFLFTFDSTKYQFTGTLTGTDTSGSGLTRNTTTINWNIAGIDPPADVPVPAAAWLFGSALIGLAGAARRKGRKS